jgi:hypothetical protein
LALTIGWIVSRWVGLGPARFYRLIPPWFESVGTFGAKIDAMVAGAVPWLETTMPFVAPATLHMLTAITAAWLVCRTAELFLSSWKKYPRDQRFIQRSILRLAEILRYATLLMLGGTIVIGIVSGMGHPVASHDPHRCEVDAHEIHIEDRVNTIREIAVKDGGYARRRQKDYD